MKKRFEYATAPRLLPDGGTVLVLGSGPSLTQDDVTYARAHVDITIAVNDTYLMAPDADVLYAGDAHWWKWHDGARAPHVHNGRKYPAFTGRYKASMLAMTRIPYADVMVFKPGQPAGLSLKPDTLNRGYNSVYQSVNFATLMGATRILLLGVDMKPGRRFTNGAWREADHFFGRHSDGTKPPYAACVGVFPSLVAPLAVAGCELINCSPDSALRCFPMRAVRDLYPEAVAV